MHLTPGGLAGLVRIHAHLTPRTAAAHAATGLALEQQPSVRLDGASQGVGQAQEEGAVATAAVADGDTAPRTAEALGAAGVVGSAAGGGTAMLLAADGSKPQEQQQLLQVGAESPGESPGEQATSQQAHSDGLPAPKLPTQAVAAAFAAAATPPPRGVHAQGVCDGDSTTALAGSPASRYAQLQADSEDADCSSPGGDASSVNSKPACARHGEPAPAAAAGGGSGLSEVEPAGQHAAHGAGSSGHAAAAGSAGFAASDRVASGSTAAAAGAAGVCGLAVAAAAAADAACGAGSERAGSAAAQPTPLLAEAAEGGARGTCIGEMQAQEQPQLQQARMPSSAAGIALASSHATGPLGGAAAAKGSTTVAHPRQQHQQKQPRGIKRLVRCACVCAAPSVRE